MIEAREQVLPRTGALSAGWRQFLPLALVLTDALAAYGAFALAYWMRYSLELGPRIQSRVTFGQYQPVAILVVVFMVAALLVRGTHRVRMSHDVVDQLSSIAGAATVTVGLVVVVTSMLHQEQFSRAVIIYVWLLLIATVGAGRVLFNAARGFCHRRGWGTLRVVVVGATDAAKMAMQSMMSRPDLGYQLAGFVYHRTVPQVRDFGRFRALGTVADIPDLIKSGTVDEVLIALPSSSHEEIWPIVRLCEEHGVGLKLVPDLFEMSLSRVRVDDLGGIPLLDIREQPLRLLARGVKRVIDVVLALLLTVLSLPLLLILMLAIRLESPGPVILRQDRVGTGGLRFRCYKLRTMKDGADGLLSELREHNEADGPIFKMRNDPRRTRVGAWMRRWSLDELPQLLNVIRGEMSMVGPRPPLPDEAAQYDETQYRRLEVKPGLTGIWQVSGRSDLPFDEMVVMDIYYVDNWSLALDVRILLRTVTAVLRRHGAY